jgi:hypothetical protein
VAVLEAFGVTPDLAHPVSGVNDGTWSASMSGKIDGDGGQLMHRSGIGPNGQPYALTEDCCEPTAAVGKPHERILVLAIAHSKAAVPVSANTGREILSRRYPLTFDL